MSPLKATKQNNDGVSTLTVEAPTILDWNSNDLCMFAILESGRYYCVIAAQSPEQSVDSLLSANHRYVTFVYFTCITSTFLQ